MARKKPLPPGLGQGTGFYTQEIVKCLEQAHRASGQRPYTVFDDWTRIVEASLTALPDQLKSVASTGRFEPDTPETGEVFKQVRARYESAHYPAAHRNVWNSFARAFALLLDSAEPGLWGQHGYGQFDCGYMGPDVLGHVYATYANSDPSWAAQYWTPWNVALLMSALVIPDGEREVYDRIKAACLHPDNILGQATILASLAIPDNEGGQPNLHRDYFFNRVIPAALPYYEPILFQEPCIGSGVQVLAAASQYPEWAVKLNLIHFHGQDIDPVAVRMARTSVMLYGLNGYALRLAEAVNVAAEARKDHPAGPVSPVKSTGAALAQAIQAYRQPADRPKAPPDELSFEMLFKQTVQPTALEDVPA